MSVENNDTENEIDDLSAEEQDRYDAERRHKQLLAAFKSLFTYLKENKSDEKVVASLTQISDSFIEKVKQFQQQELPQINIENKNEGIEEKINSLNENINNLIIIQNKTNELLSKKPVRMKPLRDMQGWINLVEIQYETINKK